MPPRSTPRRQPSRRVKVESEDVASSETAAQAEMALEETSIQIMKVDNEEEEEALGVESPGELSQAEPMEEDDTPSVLEGSIDPPQQKSAGTSSNVAAKTRAPQPARRFQTRTGIVRKSEADRKKLEQEEATRRQRRIAEAGSGQRGAQRGPRGFRGSRGGLRGREVTSGSRSQTVGEATGTSLAFERPTNQANKSAGAERVVSVEAPAGKAPENPTQIPKAPAEDHVGSSRPSVPKGKGKTAAKAKAVIAEEPVESADNVNRTDIDHINLVSSDEDDDILSSRRPHTATSRDLHGAGLRPIRLEKHEHIKRPVGIEATKLKAEPNVKSEISEQHVGHLRKAGDPTPATVDDAMQLDQHPTEKPSPTQVSSTNKKEVEIKEPPSSPELSKMKPDRKRRTSSKDSRLAHETIEEQQERLRYEKELRKISRELGTLSHLDDAIMQEEGDPISTYLDAASSTTRDGKVYLFQLPPMTPMLVHSSTHPVIDNADHPPSSSQTLKREPLPPATPATDPTPLPPADPPSISQPASSPAPPPPPPPPPPGTPGYDLLTAPTAPSSLPPLGGHLGTLRVHQSGRVTLDWGGTPMLVNWGTEVDFLQDAVVAVPAGSSPSGMAGEGGAGGEEGVGAGRKGENTVHKLAQVREKFVVVPDWGKLYE